MRRALFMLALILSGCSGCGAEPNPIGVCIAVDLPDNPVLFRPCTSLDSAGCRYDLFDRRGLLADPDEITTCRDCLGGYFDAASVDEACGGAQ